MKATIAFKQQKINTRLTTAGNSSHDSTENNLNEEITLVVHPEVDSQEQL